MQKRIIIDGCKTCPNIINLKNTFTFKGRYFCKLITVELTDIIYTHPDCPLEDYNGCDCTEFQSCEKCQTEWLPISEMKDDKKKCWIRDKNNLVGKGYGQQEEKRFMVYIDEKETPEEFEIPVMFAEIKPPSIK